MGDMSHSNDLVGAEPPEHMSETGQTLWKEMLPILIQMGRVGAKDLVALEMLCESYADFCLATEELASHRVDILDKKGKRTGRTAPARYYETVDQLGNTRYHVHPAVELQRQADMRLRSWLREFGMTPSAHAVIMASEKGVGPLLPQGGTDDEVFDVGQLSPEERDALKDMLESRVAAGKLSPP